MVPQLLKYDFKHIDLLHNKAQLLKDSLTKFCKYPRVQCYRTVYACNLLMFVISWRVCSRPFQLVTCLWIRPEAYNGVQHFGRLQPYTQTLDQVDKACHGQTLQLSTDIRKLRTIFSKILDSNLFCINTLINAVSQCVFYS